MKMKLKFIIATLVLGLFAINVSNAQSVPEFTLSTSAANAGIVLDADSPLASKYEMDISSQGFSEAQAINMANFIDEKSENIMLEVDYPNKKIILNLDTDAAATAGWDVNDWQTHLKSIF